jgi:hypothetical protein
MWRLAGVKCIYRKNTRIRPAHEEPFTFRPSSSRKRRAPPKAWFAPTKKKKSVQQSRTARPPTPYQRIIKHRAKELITVSIFKQQTE